MHFAKNLKYLRSKNNYKQKELADKVGVPRSSIANYEADTHSPMFKTLLKISEILGVKIDDLVYKDLESDENLIYEKPRTQIKGLPAFKFEPCIFEIKDGFNLPILVSGDLVISEMIENDLTFVLGKVYVVETINKYYISKNINRFGSQILILPSNTSGEYKPESLLDSAITKSFLVHYRLTSQF